MGNAVWGGVLLRDVLASLWPQVRLAAVPAVMPGLLLRLPGVEPTFACPALQPLLVSQPSSTAALACAASRIDS